jgi:hypothetical protein
VGNGLKCPVAGSGLETTFGVKMLERIPFCDLCAFLCSACSHVRPRQPKQPSLCSRCTYPITLEAVLRAEVALLAQLLAVGALQRAGVVLAVCAAALARGVCSHFEQGF